ncbi:MAG: hypothetical protein KBD01_09780 [Acidobacteria bacterium]|nr:hypothetical protein [Acidobacteriota bacterium]
MSGWSALAISLTFVSALAACGRGTGPEMPGGTTSSPALDETADAYVRLVLAIGRHDESYVDAYYGPAEWKEQAAQGEPRPLPDLLAESRVLLERVRREPQSERRSFLEKQLVAVEAFLRRLSGERMTLAEEGRALFDIDVPACPREKIDAARARLDELIPGEGDLAARVAAARAKVEIPADKLRAVVDAALAETRRRTAALVQLPPGENFRVEFVKGQPWGAYNWYKGGYQSLIQVNTDLPTSLFGVLGVVAHEGYPGHHVFNALLEDHLVRGRHWREYTVYPLHSPQSVIAEGTANVAAEVIFDDAERLEWLRGTLAPLAGVPAPEAERFESIAKAMDQLDCVMGEGARLLLDENRPESEVEAFLVRYGTSPQRARQNIRFIKGYRSYVFTYTVGKDLVEAWIGKGPDRLARFFDLLQRPVVPSELSSAPEP